MPFHFLWEITAPAADGPSINLRQANAERKDTELEGGFKGGRVDFGVLGTNIFEFTM